MRYPILCILAFGPAVYSNTVSALEPREIFKAVDPSVVVVLAADAKGEKSNLGSGVIISPQEIITSFKVVESATDIVVSQGSTLRKATLRFNDAERDLCQLHIDDTLPSGKPAMVSPSAATVEAGQDVYAVGAPRGIEHAISRAMVSSLREVASSKARLMQVDIPLTGGSIGSGVFDQNGRLIGIAAGRFKQGDSATYAAPVDWLAELPQRSADLVLNPVKTPQAPLVATPAVAAKPAWWPHVGDRWKYRLVLDKRDVGNVTLEIVEAGDRSVRELVRYDRSGGFTHNRDVEPGFNPARFQPLVALPGGYQIVELAPYASPETPFAPGMTWSDIPGRFAPQGGSSTRSANSQAKVVGQETVRVPAGEFRAWKVETISGRITDADPVFFAHCTFWYAPDAKRTIKMVLFYKSVTLALSSTQTYELVSFEPGK